MPYTPLLSLNLDIRDALRDVEHLTKQLSEKELAKATSRSINRTLIRIRTKMVSEMPKVYTLKGFQVRDRFMFENSNSNTLTGKVKAVSNRISASNFENTLIKGGISTKIIRGKKTGIGTKTGTSKLQNNLFLKVYRNQAPKNVGSAFLIHKGSGLFFAFRGKYLKTDEYQKAQFGTRRLQSLLTQSVWDMAENKQVQLVTDADARAFFLKRFESEAKFLISKQVP